MGPATSRAIRWAEFVGTAGWVLRLFSGEKHQEERGKPGMEKRGEARKEAIIATVFATNRRIVPVPGDPLGLAFYATPALEAVRAALGAGANAPPGVASDIIADAERALRMGPFSVVDKSGPPPNEDLHDYCSPAPYWWPDPEQPDGVPFIRRDGLRAPAAELFSAESGRYDRTRLQLTFDGTTSLALGWFLTGRADFAEHGARFVRTWFLDPATRMNPHLNYAQVRFGHSENRGNRQGIIEFKDVYYFLDAVRLLHHAGALTDAELSAFRGWLTEYRDWLVESEAGTAEARSHNNHGTYHELQMVAIQSFLGDRSALSRTYLRAMYRLMEQFNSEGNQPREISRPISQHYAYFNLQGWLHVLGLLRRGGYYDIDNAHQPYPRLAAAVAGLRKAAEAEWPHQQIIPFDENSA